MTSSAVPIAGRVPEEGMLVRVRGRMWVVTRTDDGSLPVDGLGSTTPHSQTVLELTSVADDARGETMRVLWEVEPGTQMYDAGELPQVVADGFDRPELFDAGMDAVS